MVEIRIILDGNRRRTGNFLFVFLKRKKILSTPFQQYHRYTSRKIAKKFIQLKKANDKVLFELSICMKNIFQVVLLSCLSSRCFFCIKHLSGSLIIVNNREDSYARFHIQCSLPGTKKKYFQRNTIIVTW